MQIVNSCNLILIIWLRGPRWQLLFNLDKCKVMTLGHPPDVSDYTMTQNDGKHISDVQRSHLERDQEDVPVSHWDILLMYLITP